MPCGTPETTSIRFDCLPSTTSYKSIAKFIIYAMVLTNEVTLWNYINSNNLL